MKIPVKGIFKYSVDDIAHWAGMSPGKCKNILNTLQNRNLITIFHDRIEIPNIHAVSRIVTVSRNSQEGQSSFLP